MPRSKATVELLLLENVENLGIVGDIVEVRPGYARNYLLPYGYATEPSPGAIKAVEERRAEVERQMKELRSQREKVIERLEGHEITLQRSANEQGVLFGSVTQGDIVDALGEEGFNISEREVRIGEPIKRLDSYQVPIQLDDDLRTELKVWVVSDKPVSQLERTDEQPVSGAEPVPGGVADITGTPDTLAEAREESDEVEEE